MRNHSRLLGGALAITVVACAPRAPRAAEGVPEARAARWERVAGWPQLPPDVKLFQPTSVALDRSGRVLVFHRAGRPFNNTGLAATEPIPDPTVVELDAATGRVLRQWGAGLFLIPHSITVDRRGHLWVTDVGRQQILELTRDGALVRAIGEWRVPGADGAHFNLPTDVAPADDGSLWVSDGYRNARVAHFDSAGRLLGAWGSKGSERGQFNIPHGIARDDRGRVYVADRENARVQLFDSTGRLLKVWPETGTSPISDVAVSRSGAVYVAFMRRPTAGNESRDVVTVLDRELEPVGHIAFDSPAVVTTHGLVVDGDSVVYVVNTAASSVVKYVKR